MSEKATLEINGQKHEFPLVTGTENEVAIDIKTLRSVTDGVITIDPGYKNTLTLPLNYLIRIPYQPEPLDAQKGGSYNEKVILRILHRCFCSRHHLGSYIYFFTGCRSTGYC